MTSLTKLSVTLMAALSSGSQSSLVEFDFVPHLHVILS